MKKIMERFRKWNENRLNNSKHYEFVYVIRNPINVAVFRQTAEEFDVIYKEVYLKPNLNASKVFLCPKCGYNDRFAGFLKSISSKCNWRFVNCYHLFKILRWEFDV